MPFIKRGEAEILRILPEDEEKRSDSDVRKVMIQASEDIENSKIKAEQQ